MLVKYADEAESHIQRWRTQLLLALDEGEGSDQPRSTHEELSHALGISKSSVYRTAKRFVEFGLEDTLNAPISGKRFTKDEEKELLELVEHYNSQQIPWTARQLARKLNRSPPTICKALARLSISVFKIHREP